MLLLVFVSICKPTGGEAGHTSLRKRKEGQGRKHYTASNKHKRILPFEDVFIPLKRFVRYFRQDWESLTYFTEEVGHYSSFLEGLVSMLRNLKYIICGHNNTLSVQLTI